MRRQTAPDDNGHGAPRTEQWAADAAAVIIGREHQARSRAAEDASGHAQLGAAVTQHGGRWMTELVVAIEAATSTFNRACGRPELTGVRTDTSRGLGTGGISVRARDGSFVLVSAQLETSAIRGTPGITVRWRMHGRETTVPFDFTGADDQLFLVWDGEPLSADAAARRILEAWLRSL